MKKWLTLLLCLALAVGLSAPAMAASADLFGQDMLGEDTYAYPLSIVAVGDRLYALIETSGSLRLAWWQEGMEEAAIAQTALESGRYRHGDTEETEANRYAATYLFTDGERVMSLNPYNGLVFAMEAEAAGEIAFTDVVTLRNTSALHHAEDESYSYMRSVTGIVVQDNTLFWLTREWTNNGKEEILLTAFDLATGEERDIPAEHVVGLSTYKDGKLLAVIYDQENAWDEKTQTLLNPTLGVMDPATGAVEEKCQFSSYNVDRVVYSESFDAAIYFDNGRVMGLKGLTEEKQYGYVAANYAEHMTLLGDNIVLGSYEGTVVRPLQADFATDEYLNIYNSWLDEGMKLFNEKYPNVPLYFSSEYYNTTEKLNQAMLSGENALDVLQMGISYSSFLTLKEKGYCADLSGDAELMAMAQRLYPVFRDAVMQDGKLVAIPINAYSFGWSYNPEVLAEMELDESFIPTDYIALCELVTEWNDGLMDDYPEYTLFEGVTDTREWMFNRMMDSYMHWCNMTGNEVSFNTPVFREMMAALESMRCDEVDRAAAQGEMDDGMWRMGVIGWGYQMVGDFTWLMEDYNTWMSIIPMKLTPDTEFFTEVQVEVMFINPRSERKALATELLKCRLAGMTEEMKHTFFVDETEPVENPYYQTIMEEYQASVDLFTEQLATAEESEKPFIQDSIDSYLEMMEMQETYRYNISPEAMERYQQEVVPAMILSKPTLFNSEQTTGESELTALMNRYRDGQINLEQFIREADQKLWMMQMENQ